MRIPGRLRHIWRRGQPVLLSALALLLIAWIYFLGIRSERTGFVERVLDPGIKRITRPVLNAFRGKPPEVPLLRVEWSEPSDTTVHTLGAWLPVRATLNGADIDLRIDTASMGHGWFRMQAPGPDGLFGMSTFHAMPATNAEPLWAWSLRAALQAQHHPVLPSEIVELAWGDGPGALYFLEQRLDSSWLAAHGGGPAMEFGDALLVNARRALQERPAQAMAIPQADWNSAPIEVRTADGVPTGNGRYGRWADRLGALRNGTMPASEILHAEATARLLAMCDLFGAAATITWWNLWFVQDSASGKLIPVPKEFHAGWPPDTLLVHRTRTPLRFPMPPGGLLDRVFGDMEIYMRYMTYLDSFIVPGWSEGLWEQLAEGRQHRLRIVASEYPGTHMDAAVVGQAVTLMRHELYPMDPALVYWQASARHEPRLVAASVHSMPVVVRALVSGADTIPLRSPQMLWPRQVGRPLVFVPLEVDAPITSQEEWRVLIGTLGAARPVAVDVRIWSTLPASNAR